MKKNILVFSNGEKIGDGIIKIPLLYEIKRRLPDYELIWLANGTTVYNNKLKLFSDRYINKVIDNANLKPFFWNKITENDFLINNKFDYIFDTQKAVLRTIALKRLDYSVFISNSANGFFSSIKLKKTINKNKYYLDELINLLNNVVKKDPDVNFKISIPKPLENMLSNIFNTEKILYLGIAPGAGEKDKIWPIEKFLDVAEYFQNKSVTIAWFLGPEEKNITKKIKSKFPNSIYPEEMISGYSSVEVVMASTKFLNCALSNDSGVSHILSTKHCPLIKLFGKKDSKKFTPKNNHIITVSANEFNSEDIIDIDKEKIIKIISNTLNL